MEAEERPLKIRKLSQDGAPERAAFQSPSGSAHPSSGPDTIASPGTDEATGKLHEETEHLTSSTRDVAASAHQNEIISDSAKSAPSLDPSGQPIDTTALSKNQQKKLRKKLEWESKRDQRKVIRKEKVVAKRERKRAAKELGAGGGELQPQMLETRARKHVQLPITIIIDCDFDDLMRDKERISLASQITRSYSDNKNSQFRAHLTVCSFGGQLRNRFDTVLRQTYKSWRGVRFVDSNFAETANQAKVSMVSSGGGVLKGAFERYSTAEDEELQALKDGGEVVYLSSESDETLHELKPYSTYIIGGLVDKNREKGICHRRATERGVKTARLPIGDFMEMQSRKVLATNHVNEIMLKWLEYGDWGEAFMKVIPKRKGGKLKNHTDGDEVDGDEVNDEASEADDELLQELDANEDEGASTLQLA